MPKDNFRQFYKPLINPAAVLGMLGTMNTIEEIGQLTAIRNHFRLALANLVVAGICVALAGYQFLRGGVVAGALIMTVTTIPIFAARIHERRARDIRGQIDVS